MSDRPELYFKKDIEWRKWLLENHSRHPQGVYLIFYKLETYIPTMRWEEAVKVALCFGWIDSTVKSIGDGKRRQYFCPRKARSTWSAINKNYIFELQKEDLLHESGIKVIETAKKNGCWSALDEVESLIIPMDLKEAFKKNPNAYSNYMHFSRGYRKSYLYWLFNAKREDTRNKRINEIIRLCEANRKTPN
jgi:uncharacterized protein YdeI (YjbR/CyaY-like superfamily)